MPSCCHWVVPSDSAPRRITRPKSGPLLVATAAAWDEAEASTEGGLQVRRSGDFSHTGLLDGWAVTGRFALSEQHGIVVVDLRFRPHPPGRDPGSGLGSDQLRIRIGDLLAQIEARLSEPYRRTAEAYPAHHDGRSAPWDPVTVQRPGGRKPRDQDQLRRIAEAYLKGGRGVTQQLAEDFDMPVPTVKDWIRRAREEGWLTPAKHGRRGAAAGPRLQEFYRQTNTEGK